MKVKLNKGVWYKFGCYIQLDKDIEIDEAEIVKQISQISGTNYFVDSCRLTIRKAKIKEGNMVNKMSVMDITGDTKVEWNPENKGEVEIAKKSYDEAVNKGFKAFRMWDDRKKGEELKKFDKYAEKIILIPPIVGG